ncbi:hypothetical protein [Bacillus sp. CDB3]|uniref:hypothetical protein n=1 Tax=Bacillus sp. CDB3 TaxID=360310 RepID=UPI0009D803FB|nr:hypothetical protein [Bacillus sp. CDB3]OQR53190.1 hypothetical protein CDB3_31595 [Bacillus sp. CDB3]
MKSANTKYVKTRVEFRIKENGVNWEDTPVIASLELDVPENDVINAVQLVAEQMAVTNGKQVRWNFFERLQGYYTRTQ